MSKMIVRRLITLLPTLFGLSIIVFGLMWLVPGDPAEILAGHGRITEPTPEQIETVRKQLGLDQPLPLRYAHWLAGVLRGDLGISMRTGQPVWAELIARFPATLELALAGLVVGLLLAVPIGVLSAVKKDSLLDQAGRLLALLGAAIPSFWLATVLILVVALHWGLLPSMGRGSLRNLVLPAIALGVGTSAIMIRLIRASLLDSLSEDYVRTARSKGLKERWVVVRHALKPAGLPVITVLGIQFGNLLGGSVIVETIFAWPGLGKLIIDSILARDFPLIQGFALLMGVVFILVNTCVDMAYGWLDPRVHHP